MKGSEFISLFYLGLSIIFTILFSIFFIAVENEYANWVTGILALFSLILAYFKGRKSFV